jgi:hypothetical protein
LPCQDVALELPGRGEGEVVENLDLFGELICYAALSEEVKDLNEEEAGPARGMTERQLRLPRRTSGTPS